ncbi:MAG: exosortase/archaeosortase family protein [Pirellulales bacterium]
MRQKNNRNEHVPLGRRAPLDASPPADSEQPLASDSVREGEPIAGLGTGESVSPLTIGLLALPLAATFFWAYWPTLSGLVAAWDREADYSHGYLVAPLALWFLWSRRDQFPGIDRRYAWLGLVLIGVSFGIRAVGAALFVDAIDGWSMIPWLAGAVWVVCGPRVARWSAPAIAFLVFMIPLPFMIERGLSVPLQRIATQLSVAALQTLGRPALAEGNVILLGDYRLEVAEACSGLRIFMSVVALACAYALIARRPWWQKVVLMLAIAPIALVANASRIVATGLMYEFASSDLARRFSHDFAGWMMIPLAAALFGFTLWYLGKLVRVEECVDPRMMPRRGELGAKAEAV